MRASLYRAAGAYLGLAVGDALGATVEFLTPNEIACQHGVHRDVVGGGWLNLSPGQVTDDTTMSLTLGRAILGTGSIDATAVAQAFSDWMAAKPVDIGHTVRRGIVEFRRTGRTEVAESEYGAGNGACMRTLPVALATLGAPSEVVRAAVHTQARTTHHNPLSDAGTECVVEMIQAAVGGVSDIQRLRPYADALVGRHPVFAFDGKREENPSGYIVHTLRAVFQALFSNDGFEAALVDVVNRGGDADTTGAIAGMIAGALHGPEGIPPRWLAAIGPAMQSECERQAGDLLSLSPLMKEKAKPCPGEAGTSPR